MKMRTFLKMNIIILSMFLCAEIGFLTYVMTSAKNVFSRNLNLGNKYLLSQDYENAITAFSKAIDIDDMNADAYIGRGEAYKAIGDYASAWDDFNKAQALSGDMELLTKYFGKTEITVVSGNGEEVDGAAIKLEGETHSYNLKTDGRGVASEVIFPEIYHAEISKENYESVSLELSAENGGSVIEPIELRLEESQAVESVEEDIDYDSLYMDYARDLQSGSNVQLYMKIIGSDEPLLIIAEDCVYKSFDSVTYGYIDLVCYVYQYSSSEGKIVFIGKVSSDGSGRPLRWQGDSVKYASIHKKWTLSANDGIGTVLSVNDGVNTPDHIITKEQWTLKNDELEQIDSEVIDIDESDRLSDEYYYDGEILYFDPIT